MYNTTQDPNTRIPFCRSLGSAAQPTSVNSQFARLQDANPLVYDFSIVMGGPVYDFLLRVGLLSGGLENVLRRTVALVGITWVPLLLLSLVQALFTSHRVTIPLFSDFATYGRFLLALPLLLLAEVLIDPAVRSAVKDFVDTRIVQEKEVPEFEDVLLRLQRLRDSWIPEIVLLVLAFFPVFLFRNDWTAGTLSSWHTTARGLTPAGWWYAAISSPVLRFIAYRWIFRYFIWALLLWRISRLNLHLMPTHPDRSAGLDFLSRTQRHFGILLGALGCSFAGHLVNGLVHEGVSFASYKFLIGGFLAFSLVLGVLPLTLLAPALARVRRAGLREYGKLGNQYAEAFDRKWVHTDAQPSEPLLGTRDIRSLADLANSYAIVPIVSQCPFEHQDNQRKLKRFEMRYEHHCERPSRKTNANSRNRFSPDFSLLRFQLLVLLVALCLRVLFWLLHTPAGTAPTIVATFVTSNVAIGLLLGSRPLFENRESPWNWIVYIPVLLCTGVIESTVAELPLYLIFRQHSVSILRAPFGMAITLIAGILYFAFDEFRSRLEARNRQLQSQVQLGLTEKQSHQSDLEQAHEIQMQGAGSGGRCYGAAGEILHR